ncbi:MAG: hypothetical protein HYV41_01550, partial [Candidatus Magasanikbacteria bacterium]|nr:hypothetical protein [Candidatus Magasanikbacteria bacterium]
MNISQFGFNDSESAVYLALNQYGELDVPKTVEHTDLSRTTVYEALTMLLGKGFIDYRKEGRNAYYKAGHPNKLAGILEEKKRENTLSMGEMEETIRALTGSFNLVQNKPGVRFFEGEQGVYDVLNYIADGFIPNTEILSFVKVKPMQYEQQLDTAVENFLKKRIKANVKTLVLAIDSPEARALKKEDENALRETRLVSSGDTFLDFVGGEIFIYKDEI